MTASTEASADAAPSSERFPEFFVVGHQKCGTTALYEMLRRHPRVFMPDVKETWYFSPELRSTSKRMRVVPGRPETLAQYMSLFEEARPGQRLGENSPAYLMSKTAAARIARAQPDARIIAILREPASFLRSFHLQCVRNHVETEANFARAIALEDARRQGKRIPRHSHRPHELLYSDHVKYVEQLRRYHQVFPRDRVLVLIYEEFRDNNEATVREVLNFLDVADDAPIEVVEANPSVSVRSARMHELVRTVYVGRGPLSRGVKRAVKAVSTKRMRVGALKATQKRLLYAEPQQVDQSVMLELRRRFKDEVAATSDYLGRDLVTLWGYDRID
jgi:Sulfotransferase family